MTERTIAGIGLAALLWVSAVRGAVHVIVRHEFSVGSGPLVEVPASVEVLQQVCQYFKQDNITLASSQPGESNSGFNFGVRAALAPDGSSGITVNGQPADVSVTLDPCDLSVMTTLAWMGGSASAYVFHIGGGGPVVHRFFGSFTFSDRTVFELPAAMTLEMPVRLSGGLVAGESFGDPEETFAKGKLSLSGPFGLSESISVESVSVIPEQAGIDRATTVAFHLPAGRSEMSWTISGSFEGEASAKGTGLFGMISGAATVAVQFPGSFEIRNFTGPGGGPLPPGVKIYSAESGLVYAGPTGPRAPRITKAEFVAGEFRITWESEAGRQYRVETAPSLPGAWSVLAGGLEANGQETSYSHAGRFGGAGYYRVALE